MKTERIGVDQGRHAHPIEGAEGETDHLSRYRSKNNTLNGVLQMPPPAIPLNRKADLLILQRINETVLKKDLTKPINVLT